MKKKIMAMCLVIAMAATAVIGGTLAYFTDTDEAENVFTMGNVKIDLLEKQFEKDADGKEILKDFVDDKVLMPGTQNQNKQDKIIAIKNTGASEAYVWYEWWIPTALDSTDGSTGTNNILHVNSYGATWDKYINNGYTLPEEFKNEDTYLQASANAAWDHDPEVETKVPVGPQGYFRQETVTYGEGTDAYTVQYNVYVVMFTGKVPAGKTTPPAMNGVYLDMDLDFDGTQYTCFGKPVNFDFTKDIKIPVKAFAIQADGFNTVYDAYAAYVAQSK